MSITDELENAVDIVDLVQKYTKIKKAGVNYKAACPFPGHSEKTPSFVVSPAKQLAYCFGCHKGGGPLKFIMDIENCEFRESMQILGGVTGIKVGNADPEKIKLTKSLYHIYKDATYYYKQALTKYPEVKKELIDRGLNDELIAQFEFGYSDSGVELYNFLKGKGYEDKMIEDSQIFNSVSQKKDKFINRIIFPIQNARGDYIAFAGRIIGKGEPKYLNSPATSIYDKSSVLYGLFKARSAITKNDFVIITEGYMDTISLVDAGFKNTVAVSGTALTDKHMTILKRLTHKIYLCFDGDTAGEKATKLSIENLKNKDLEIRVILLPKGSDPDDYIKSGGNFQELIEKAVSPIGFLIQKSNFNTNSIDEKKKFLKEILEVLKSYTSIIEKDYYLKEIAIKLGLRENTVYEAFNKTRLKKQFGIESTISKTDYSSEDYAIGYILSSLDNLKYIKDHIIFPEYINPELQKFLDSGESALDNMELNSKERYKALSMKIESTALEQTNEVIGNTLDKLVKKINLDTYKKAITSLKEKMNAGDNNAFGEYSEIVKKAKKMGLK
ncbi:DNA primase [Candidatus Gracilibacteria bacterium]|nr:DNA primase [Candidatus Gracilibacteria bacterium]